MRYAFLVAWREFAENIKTKGFWIGILIFPLLIWGSITISTVLEKAKPVLNFVLVDQSGELEGSVERALDRLHERKLLGALSSYARKHSRPPEGDTRGHYEKMPAVDAAELAEKWASDNPETVEEFVRGGGLTAALTQLKPYLTEDAPEFSEPKRPFRKVPLPEGVDPAASPDAIADALKPYVREERAIIVDGETSELFAAVFIPADALERVVRPGD